MIRHTFAAVAVTLFTGAPGLAEPEQSAPPSPDVLDFTMDRLDGTPEDLSVYRGKVVMIVNTASLCGLTPQYEGLQALYEKHRDDGFVILGFPANNFGGQEPGTHEQIREFCKSNYNVTFPLFAKVSVKGDDICPLYGFLTQETPEEIRGPIKWNFQKYLVNRNGQVVTRFLPSMSDDSAEIRKKIESLLRAPRPDEAEKS